MHRTTPTLLLLMLALPLAAQAQTSTMQPDLPAAAASAYQQGVEAEQLNEYDVALERFQAAQKAAPDAQLCLQAIARTQQEMGDDKAALATMNRMIAAAGTPQTRAQAELLEAQLYSRQWHGYSNGSDGLKRNPHKAEDALRKAETMLARAASDDSTNEPIRLEHAHVLALLHRDADACSELNSCAAMPGISPAEHARALKLAANVELARMEPAPVFRLTTMDGKPVTLDSLHGKVVLIDFWGAWCPHCVHDTDYVQSMLDSFDDQHFVLLEVDANDSVTRWKSYIAAHHMKGLQTRDEHEQMQTSFGVTGFPTYVILDGDGVERKRFIGSVGDLRGTIRGLIQTTQPAATASNSPDTKQRSAYSDEQTQRSAQ